MEIDPLWRAMECEALAANAPKSGWLLRLVQPASDCTLSLGLDLKQRRRALLLRTSQSLIPPRRHWPPSNGLQPFGVMLGPNAYFGVSLENTRHGDVFTAFAEELWRRFSGAVTPEAQLTAFLDHIATWPNFLSASLPVLVIEAQAQLWAELHFLRDELLPVIARHSLFGWYRSIPPYQNFEYEGGSIEVKGILAANSDHVRINGLRQLDHSLWPALYLHVISVDQTSPGEGETLPQIIASLRTHFTTEGLADEFDDRLQKAGYYDLHSSRYADRAFALNSQTTFHVTVDFPALTERNTPAAVTGVTYDLDLSQCKSHIISESDFKKFLACLR